MYITKIVVNCCLAICISSASSGCSEAVPDTKTTKAVFTLPYVSGCETAVQKTREVFDRINERNEVLLDIETVPFDITPISHSELLGYIVLSAEGDWRTLSSKTPMEYLQINANGIVMDCMPNNGFNIAWEELGALNAILKSTSRKGKAYPKISDDGLRLYFNDGSYTVPKL